MVKVKNYDVIEDENTGDPVVLERVIVNPPTQTKNKKGLTTAEDTRAADIDDNVKDDYDDHTIAYCNHCNAYIRPEEKDKLRSLIIRKDNDKVVDVQRQYYGLDEETNDVLVAEAPDVLESYYEGRQPKLSGVWSQMFGKGSTKKLLDYTETYPASNTRKRYSGDETGQLTGKNIGYNTPVHNSTAYAREEKKLTFREEKGNAISGSAIGAVDGSKVSRSPKPAVTHKGSSTDFNKLYKNNMRDQKRRRTRTR